MTIVEFLLARIAEDETEARECSDPYAQGNWRTYENDVGTIAMTKDRALAECAAKRAIVERNEPYDDIQVRRQTRTLAGDTLRDLAAVYADHPDYREEWKL